MHLAQCVTAVGNNISSPDLAGGSGNFLLNVMLPVIAYNVLQGIDLLTGSRRALSPVITAFSVNVYVLLAPDKLI